MQRTEIHLQITEVAEKIIVINRHLSQSSKLLKAESDLMQAYLKELQVLSAQLEKTIASSTSQPQSDIIINVEKQEVIIPEIKPEMQQHEIKRETSVKVTVAEPETEPVKTATVKQKETLTSKSLNERFTNKSVSLSEKLQSHSGRHLKDLFSISDKFMFANELFKNDQKHFEEVLKKINEFDSLEDAFNYIEGELKTKFNWDKKQNIVEQFQEVIKKRFR
jgi:hypothetical protein